jgi:hypothetical protein
MRKLTNTLSPSPKGFKSPKFSDSDMREVCGLGLGLGRPKSSIISYPYPGPIKEYYILSLSRQKKDMDILYILLFQKSSNIFVKRQHCHSF